jgi:hypothetical protein
MDDNIRDVLNTYPFLSYGTMLDIPYLGIVQNCDTQLISIYLITAIADAARRKDFLAAGDSWWWNSNRQVPINIFLKRQFDFRDCLKHFSRKDFNLEAGPAVSLQETIARRVRKRQITLVRGQPGIVPIT